MKKIKHNSDLEYIILSKFIDNPHLTQRQLSKTLGLSLGKTNYLIRALFDKGWVKLNNFRKSDNKLGYKYILTPEGVETKRKLAKQFLINKSKEYNKLKKEIEKLTNYNE